MKVISILAQLESILTSKTNATRFDSDWCFCSVEFILAMTNLLPPLFLFADAGVPMIFFTLPAMLVLLIPIIVIEGFLCKKWLGLTTWEAMKSNAVSNLVSTVIGVPLAWALMFGVEMASMGIVDWKYPNQDWHSPIANVIFFLLSSAWIGPPGERTLWIVPAATLVLLVPFFLASYGIEYLVVGHMVGTPEGGPPNVAYPRVRMAVRNANLITYGAMFIGTSVWLLTRLPHR